MIASKPSFISALPRALVRACAVDAGAAGAAAMKCSTSTSAVAACIAIVSCAMGARASIALCTDGLTPRLLSPL
eukprot:653298-Amphidinium_carterae.1